MGRNGVFGIIVPIHDDGVMHDVFHGKSVHASFAQSEGTDLEKGDRIVFFDSRGTRALRGEAVIAEIAFEGATKVLDNLGGKLYMDKADFEAYVSTLPEGTSSKLRVLHFKDPTMYANPVTCDLAIAESGTYMTAEVFARIAKGNP
jgi:hypothetical protein